MSTEPPIPLLPCPFYGDDDILPVFDLETEVWECGCDICDIPATASTEQEAIAKWNTRTIKRGNS